MTLAFGWTTEATAGAVRGGSTDPVALEFSCTAEADVIPAASLPPNREDSR